MINNIKTTLALSCVLTTGVAFSAKNNRVNVMLIVADDLGYEEVGCLGATKGLTPNVDKLAAQGVLFTHAYVNVAICMPSRGVLGTGRYGHNSGMVGFINCNKDVPTIMEVLQKNDYMTGILGKVKHSTPKADYKWDFVQDYRELGAGRSPQKYYNFSKQFFAKSKQAGKPFYFMVNSHDPHRPFQRPGKFKKGSEEPSKWYKAKDVTVPSYLPDHPKVREDLTYYYNSVRRFDDTVGLALKALKESGMAKNTLVMLISDNGIPVPFAKCNTYLVSNKTPWIVRWPGKVKPGRVDKQHFISGVDYFPTVMAAIGIKPPEKLDGRSFLPLLEGKTQTGREYVFTQIDHKIGSGQNARYPMRSIQNKQYGYIFNAWSNGKKRYHNSNEKLTMEGMEDAAKSDPKVAARIKVYRYRTPEEFYDLQNDPGCTKNLINDSQYKQVIEDFQKRLRNWMVKYNDPLLPAFDQRGDAEAVLKVLNSTYPTIPRKKNNKKRKKLSAEERKKRRAARRRKQLEQQP